MPRNSTTRFGFREGRLTHQAILSVWTLIQKVLDQKQGWVLVFVGLRKGFDLVLRLKMLNRMIEVGCWTFGTQMVYRDQTKPHLSKSGFYLIQSCLLRRMRTLRY